MSENKAKGDLFHHVLAYVNKKWGKESLEKLGKAQKDYRPADWYSFPEFCNILTDINTKLGNSDGQAVNQMGCEMIKNDFRWRTIFKGRNPVYVFITTKRQDTQYTGGVYSARVIEDKSIRIYISDWDCDFIWYEFIRGRLQGVLELTGHDGVVDMKRADEVESGYIYDITWK